MRLRKIEDDEDNPDIVRDGEVVRVPWFMLDGRPVTFDVAAHMPVRNRAAS